MSWETFWSELVGSGWICSDSELSRSDQIWLDSERIWADLTMSERICSDLVGQCKVLAEGINPPHKTSLTSFLTKAFDLEEQQ